MVNCLPFIASALALSFVLTSQRADAAPVAPPSVIGGLIKTHRLNVVHLGDSFQRATPLVPMMC